MCYLSQLKRSLKLGAIGDDEHKNVTSNIRSEYPNNFHPIQKHLIKKKQTNETRAITVLRI